jgi:hypothetical protein
MEYRTVFDIVKVGYKSWWFPAAGLILVAVGAGLVLLGPRSPSWSKRPGWNRAIAFGFLGFAVFWTLVTFLSTYSEYAHLRAAVDEGRFRTVEGVVSGFRPMPVSGHSMEHFCVRDECFEYSDYMIIAGFNNTSSHGGPIREGMAVRVSYVGDEIVKLEVAK